jgi:glycosyltransferase involved in cell wall biosynthesis
MPSLSIVIPAYNEEKRIGKTLDVYSEYFDGLLESGKLDYELLVVINNSIDGTEKVVKEKTGKNSRIRYLNFPQGGKGFAIMEGFKDALKRDNELIGFVDADMSTPPDSYYDLVKKIGDSDAIIAARWRKDSVVKEKKSQLRKAYSWGFNSLVKSILFLRFSDTQCGAKLLTRAALEKIIVEKAITKWAFDVDLLYKLKKKKLKVVEVPTYWEDKAGSTINIISPIQMLVAVVRLRLTHSPFRFVVRAYDKLPERMKMHNL